MRTTIPIDGNHSLRPDENSLHMGDSWRRRESNPRNLPSAFRSDVVPLRLLSGVELLSPAWSAEA